MKRYSFIMRWNSSFISLSNNEEIFFQYDVESLHIYAVAVHVGACKVVSSVCTCPILSLKRSSVESIVKKK